MSNTTSHRGSSTSGTLPVAVDVLQLRFTELQHSARATELHHQSQISDMRTAIAGLTSQLDHVKQHIAADEAWKKRIVTGLDRVEDSLDKEGVLGIDRLVFDVFHDLSDTRFGIKCRESEIPVLYRKIRDVASGVTPAIVLSTTPVEHIVYSASPPGSPHPVSGPLSPSF
ncbi:hypothetical protein EUX98_g9127 [Antrodiella citrinella]|uniref:Uncharacterized protein n=1 Tax=Antrodiella citrinella TaxID=2447956 RepID=A0A4S4LZ90_9APHY|nr:hypothetical protein EUX98_g9127 [Antrodiella citrinella]